MWPTFAEWVGILGRVTKGRMKGSRADFRGSWGLYDLCWLAVGLAMESPTSACNFGCRL